ncbi:MAG: lytic transglycosylase domain-containing protein, partial [Candidatus Binatia bacterium]
NRHAVSPKGARGLMQLMPRTARHWGVRNVYDARENIRGGIRHLRMLMDRYRNRLTHVLAAYNAGVAPVERYRGIPPYRETRTYVTRVLRYRQQYLREQQAAGTLASRS